jgi:hypothetical protein
MDGSMHELNGKYGFWWWLPDSTWVYFQTKIPNLG